MIKLELADIDSAFGWIQTWGDEADTIQQIHIADKNDKNQIQIDYKDCDLWLKHLSAFGCTVVKDVRKGVELRKILPLEEFLKEFTNE